MTASKDTENESWPTQLTVVHDRRTIVSRVVVHGTVDVRRDHRAVEALDEHVCSLAVVV